MARRPTPRDPAPSAPAAPPSGPPPGALLGATVLALATGALALFQWQQLAIARAGGEAFCAFGESGSCTAVWDSPFARAVEAALGLPVAGLGVAWSLAALVLPLVAWTRGGDRGGIGWVGTSLVALGGVVAVLVLAAVSLVGGHLCPTCAVTWLLVLGYAAVVFRALPHTEPAGWLRGGAAAFAVGLVGFVVLRLVAPEATRTPLPPPPQAAPLPQEPEAALAAWVQSLPPEGAQALADALASWRQAPEVPVRDPRALVGPSDARIRITEFSDALCSHCARLHEGLEELRETQAGDRFAIERRNFPLDGTCNPEIPRATPDGLRCLAAKARICMEGRPGAFAFDDALFASQTQLTPERLRSIATPYLEAEALEACLGSPETEAKLADDIAWAMAHEIEGTPLVLVDGRRAPASPPVLYALALAGGDIDHPAFAALPRPSPPESAAAH